MAKETKMPKINKKVFGVLALSIMLASCAMVGPDYQTVSPDAPPKWNGDMSHGLRSDQTDTTSLAQWWKVFNDPLLEELEASAVTGNLDLQAAKSRLREARALRDISHTALLPTVDSTAAANKFRTPATGENNLFAAGFDAVWELDIFGGRRRAIEAAEAHVTAANEALHDVMVSLTAEIGMNYIDVRAYQARLAAARHDLNAQQQTYELNQSRYQSGLIDELAVQQSRYNLELTRAHIPQLEIGLAAAMNRLSLLIGDNPGSLTSKLDKVRPVPPAPPAIMVGVPAETLRRRPDIRQAERELAAQTAKIGVAQADLYPKFSLTGSIGLESLALENLPEWASRTFQIGPSFSWNIFDAGRIRQNIEVQNARQEQAMLHYQATVLRALEEVENTLVAFVQEENRNNALTMATEAAKQAELVAKDRYDAGISDFSDVLDAQRSLHSFQDQLAQSTGVVTSNLIRLYKALGGGWQPNEKVRVIGAENSL